MSEQKNGGSAFPSYASDHRGAACNTTFEPRGGITMRDYFAARATEEDIEEHRGYRVNTKSGSREYVLTREQAKYAYADAMLRARQEINHD